MSFVPKNFMRNSPSRGATKRTNITKQSFNKFDNLFSNEKIILRRTQSIDISRSNSINGKKVSNKSKYTSIPLLNNLQRHLSVQVMRQNSTSRYSVVFKHQGQDEHKKGFKMQIKISSNNFQRANQAPFQGQILQTELYEKNSLRSTPHKLHTAIFQNQQLARSKQILTARHKWKLLFGNDFENVMSKKTQDLLNKKIPSNQIAFNVQGNGIKRTGPQRNYETIFKLRSSASLATRSSPRQKFFTRFSGQQTHTVMEE